MERPDLHAMASRLMDRFRLGSYEIHVGYVKNLTSANGGYVYGLMSPHADSARIWIGIQDPDTWDEEAGLACTPENIRRVLIHELMHVRLCALTSGMKTWTEITMEEQAVHALADAYADATAGEEIAFERTFKVLPFPRAKDLRQCGARAFSRAMVPVSNTETRMENPEKTLGMAILLLALLAEKGEGPIKEAASESMRRLTEAAGDKAEAAIAMAKADLSNGDGAANGNGNGNGGDGAMSEEERMQRLRAMSDEERMRAMEGMSEDEKARAKRYMETKDEEEKARAFGGMTLAKAIEAGLGAHAQAAKAVTDERAKLLEENKHRIPETCRAYTESCPIPDLHAFLAAMPKLPHPKPNDGKGFRVGTLRERQGATTDVQVNRAFEAAGLRQKDVERKSAQHGLDPKKVAAAMKKLVVVNPINAE